jgi:hypothetical protein
LSAGEVRVLAHRRFGSVGLRARDHGIIEADGLGPFVGFYWFPSPSPRHRRGTQRNANGRGRRVPDGLPLLGG